MKISRRTHIDLFLKRTGLDKAKWPRRKNWYKLERSPLLLPFQSHSSR